MSASHSEAILLTQLQRKILANLKEQSDDSNPVSRRASLILKIADGNPSTTTVSKELGVSFSTVRTWRQRWLSSKSELAAVEEAGAPESVLESRISKVLANRLPNTQDSQRKRVRSSQPLPSNLSFSESVSSNSARISLTSEELAELIDLRQQVELLAEENSDLALILETMTEHSDLVSDELHQEKEDLAFMLEMTTEHSDTVSEELQEKAEEALRESERRLRLIVQATPVPVIITRIADQEVQYANHMAGPLLGIDDEAVIGRLLGDFFVEDNIWQALMDELASTDAIDEFEMEMAQSAGDRIWVTVSIRPLEFNDAPSVLAAFHDITERKIGEMRLQSQVEKLRLELDEARQSSIVAEQSGTAFFTNMDALEIKHTGIRLVAIHSFRGGTGKSLIVANMAALLAASGQRVGIIDTSLQSPGVHMFFGVDGHSVEHTFNDLLWESCSLNEVAYDVTPHLGTPVAGCIFLIPASVNPGQMAQMLSQGYVADALTNNLSLISEELQLDILLIDTHPGLNEEALLAMGSAHAVVVVMRPEQQDYEGTGVALQIAQKLQVPSISIVVNNVPSAYELSTVKARAEQAFGTPVAAVLPYAPELATFDGSATFVMKHPGHPITTSLQHMASRLMGVAIQDDEAAAPNLEMADSVATSDASAISHTKDAIVA